MGLSSEQVAELTKRINGRLDEWEFPEDFVISTHLPRGLVRLVHDEIAAWEAEQDEEVLGEYTNARAAAYEKGFERGYAEAERVAMPVQVSPDPDALQDVYHFAFERDKAAHRFSGPEAHAPVDDTPRLVTNSAPEPAVAEPHENGSPKSDEKLTTALEPHSNGHLPALPDPDIARERLAQAVAVGNNGQHNLVAVLKTPRTLAEVDAEVASVWGDDDPADDDTDDAPAKRVRPNGKRTPRPRPTGYATKHAKPQRTMQPDLAQLVAEVQRQAMAGVMPSQAQFDDAKPATWPLVSGLCQRLGVSWDDLRLKAGLKPREPQAKLRAG